MRNYAAYKDSHIVNDISFDVIDVRTKDKYLTKYKGYIIEGYKGIYRLQGGKEELNFLYNCGIGAKNSQGFGMFEVIKR